VFGERLVPGGILVMDDYGTDECPGVIEAVEAWALVQGDRFTIERTAYPTYQAIITKNRIEARYGEPVRATGPGAG